MGATHNSDVTFFQMNGMATPGVERVAELGSNGVFNTYQYERKQLICDMENPKNIFRFLDYYAKFNFG